MTDARDPLVSIVILNYNGKHFLDRCLTSIFGQSFANFEIIFVDNKSVDGSVDYIKSRFGYDVRLRIVQNKGNSGPIEGNNVGIRIANQNAKYILILNNDTELTKDWLNGMINTMEENPKIGAACSKQLLMQDPNRLQGFGSFIDQCGFNYQLGDNELDTGQYNGATFEIFAGGTTALLIRSDLLGQIGLLDSSYDFGFDDVDLCWRVWLSGHKVVCVSSCAIYHKVSGTPRNIPHVLFHREKNRIMTIIKNYGLLYQLRFLPLILSLDLSQLLWFAFTNNFHMFRAIARALVWALTHFKYMWTQHLKIKYCIRKVSDKEITSHMLKINLLELWRRIGSQHLSK